MKEAVVHVERPRLPWRVEGPSITECGCSTDDVETITRAILAEREKEWGDYRTMMTTCVTCLRTARRWDDWGADPCSAIGREVEWETRFWATSKRGHRLRDELRAIALLIARHSEEFAGLVRGLANAVDLSTERTERKVRR